MIYLTALGRDRAEIDRYIEGMGEVLKVQQTRKDRTAAIITAEDETRANWLTGRLASGMLGGHQQKDLADAEKVLDTLVYCC